MAWTAVIAVIFNIVLHEFGHLIACKLFGYRITAIKCGFGPELFTVKVHEMHVAVRALPVAFSLQVDNWPAKGEFVNRALVIIAGPFTNLAIAILLYYMATGTLWRNTFGGSLFISGDWTLELLLASTISAGFGIVNLVPLPPLDGGALALLALESLLSERAFGPLKKVVDRAGTSIVVATSALCFVGALLLFGCSARLP